MDQKRRRKSRSWPNSDIPFCSSSDSSWREMYLPRPPPDGLSDRSLDLDFEDLMGFSPANSVPESPPKEEGFLRKSGLITAVVDYISKLSSQHRLIIGMLESLKDLPEIQSSTIPMDPDLVLLGQELRVFFRVPDQQIRSNIGPTSDPNQFVSVFIINLLLVIVQLILHFEPDSIVSVKGSIQNLQAELEFLVTFLGDTAMHLQPTENIVIDIEAVVNEVGRFLYCFFLTIVVFFWEKRKYSVREPEYYINITDVRALFTEVRSFFCSHFSTFFEEASPLGVFLFLENDQVPESGRLELVLSDLLAKFEVLKVKIKEHCITVSKMPSDIASNTAVVSLFIVDSVLQDLMYLINNKSDTTIDVKDQILMLHEELMLLGISISDVSMQQDVENEQLIIRTTDVAYEVEYVINSFAQVWYLTLRLPQLVEKIRLLRKAIQKINDKIDASGALEGAKYPDKQVSSQPNEHYVLAEIVVGFEKEMATIVDQLVRGPNQLQIISIFGMPGLGKTTLATKLYTHSTVVLHFDDRGWCVVSQAYTKRDMLIDILMSMCHHSLKREEIMNMEDGSLAEKLYKSLKGKRYLVVFDDIWDVNAWNDLDRYFPNDNVGSRILFTSRNKEVGLKASPHSAINTLSLLSEDECWELLHRKVFQDKNCPKELLKIGKQIARNCHRLPLKVVLIAGVLANMKKEKHLWQNVARNLSSNKSQFAKESIQALELSYRHLPVYLKPCFLYFGAFEEDKEIPVRKLTSLWIAEGFIKQRENKSLEEVAENYLLELIDRSLVLVAKRRFDSGIKTCKIHDLLREMCLRIAEDKHFLMMVKLYEDDPHWLFSQVSIYQRHRHLNIDYGANPISSLPSGQHMHSFFCAHRQLSTLISCSSRVLRVLNFYRGSGFVDVMGSGHLVNLRYLAFSGTLPQMESFHKLEYLYVDNSHAVEIPDTLLNMVNLRCMHLKGGAYFSANRRQQATKDEGFQMTNNLHGICLISISDRTDEKILRCFSNLRSLKGMVRSSVNYCLDFLKQLESLKLSPNYNVLNYIFSSFFSLPVNLKSLTLVDIYVSPKQMEIIGRLPNLEVLKLKNVGFRGGQWDTSEGEFQQLKFLKLYNVRLEEWNTSEDHFPKLQRLELLHCHQMKMIPSSFGYILTLQKIEVYGCAQSIKESAEQIREEQEDIGNYELQVITSDK